jgi:hypothetical protein
VTVECVLRGHGWSLAEPSSLGVGVLCCLKTHWNKGKINIKTFVEMVDTGLEKCKD